MEAQSDPAYDKLVERIEALEKERDEESAAISSNDKLVEELDAIVEAIEANTVVIKDGFTDTHVDIQAYMRSGEENM